MPGPSGSLIVDASGIPVPQFWDFGLGAWSYLYGDGTRHELFARQAPIVPVRSAAYEAAHNFKASAGTFFGCSGQYNSTTTEAWIMVFDSNGAPAGAAVPLVSTGVGPKTAGQGDTNWFISIGKPYTFSAGLYIAISTTGGNYTSTANANMVVTAEFV